MIKKKISEAVDQLEDRHIEEAADFRVARKKKGWIKWGAIAACFLLLLSLAVLPYLVRMGKDPTGFDLWKYKGKVGQNTVFSRQAPNGISLTLTISPAADLDRYAAEEDACAVLFGQYLTTIYAFDYEAHFKAFPASLVEKAFTSQVSEKGMDYNTALQSIDAVVGKLVSFEEFELSYRVDSFESHLPGTSGFDAMLEGYDSWFEKAGVPLSEIGEIRVYYFTDLAVSFNDLYTQTGDPGLSLEQGFRFYKQDGKWQYWPSKIEDDLSVDLALADDENAAYFKQAQTSGVITAIEGDYISLGGEERYYAPGLLKGLQEGDQVVLAYYRSFGISVKTEQGEIKLHRVVSLEKQAGTNLVNVE